MNKNSTKKLLLTILCIVLIAATALFATGCSNDKAPGDSTPGTTETTGTSQTTEPSIPAGVTVKGEGQTSFSFHVTDTDGTVTKFLVKTDKTVVGDALLDCGLIVGDASDYGLYVTSVNGITADWDTEKAYWAFYIDGEYAQTGVDATDITPDAVYAFVKTVSE